MNKEEIEFLAKQALNKHITDNMGIPNITFGQLRPDDRPEWNIHYLAIRCKLCHSQQKVESTRTQLVMVEGCRFCDYGGRNK